MRARRFARRFGEHVQASGLSARALSLRAGLGPAYVHNILQARWIPRPQALDKLARALRLTPFQVAELRALVGVDPEPLEQAATAWHRLIPALFEEVRHDEFFIPGPASDEQSVDLARGFGALVSWLTLRISPPTKRPAARLRQAACTLFDRALAFYRERGIDEHPESVAAWHVASELPRAWRSEVFRTAQAAVRAVRVLRYWHWSPNDTACPLSADLKDRDLHRDYQFQRQPVSLVSNVHDAMIAHRLWALLDLGRHAGPVGISSQQSEVERQFSPYNGDLYVLLQSLDFLGVSSTSERAERTRALNDVARRVDMGLRLYEIPELAEQVFHRPRAELEKLLAQAAELTGGFSVRYPV